MRPPPMLSVLVRAVMVALYPFTGLIRCGKWGAPYRRKHAAAGTKYEKIVWICTTFNSLGKVECDSQQIPEDILDGLAAGLGGTDGIAEILVPEAKRLVFHMKNGQTILREWQNLSRRQSWTPEMREATRQKSLERSARKRNATERYDHSGDHYAAETEHI